MQLERIARAEGGTGASEEKPFAEKSKEDRMNIERCFTVLAVLALAACFLVTPTIPAQAQEEVSAQSQTAVQGRVDEAVRQRLHLRNQLRMETGLSAEELDAIDPYIEEALRLNGGDAGPIREMVRKAVQADCVGQCLVERIRLQNRIMLQKREQPEDAERTAYQQRLRTHTEDGEQSGDLTRTRTRSQNRTQGEDSSSGSTGRRR